MIYRERVSYHESIEEELKKNIESQVDVVLKMEEERLLMLKDNKELKDRSDKVKLENDEYKRRMELFEKELKELQREIKENQNKENSSVTTEEVSESESTKKGSTNVIKKKPLSFKQPNTSKQTAKKGAISALKFSPAMAKAN